MLKIFSMITLFVLVSCASRHASMRGSVALKINETTGIVCNEPNSTKVGDHLSLYQNVCSTKEFGDQRGSATCKMVKAGEVEITRIVNEHYSEFKTLVPLKFEEGSIVRPED